MRFHNSVLAVALGSALLLGGAHPWLKPIAQAHPIVSRPALHSWVGTAPAGATHVVSKAKPALSGELTREHAAADTDNVQQGDQTGTDSQVGTPDAADNMDGESTVAVDADNVEVQQ